MSVDSITVLRYLVSITKHRYNGAERMPMGARKSLFEEVSDRLSDMILVEGKFAPGEKLPNKIELAQLFNVGRTTVWEAIKTLVTRGVVYI